MSTYDDVYEVKATSSLLKNRMTVAVAKAAVDIINEDEGTVNHANRLVWAETALANPETMAQRMIWACLADATLRAAFLGADPASSEDSVVQNAVNANIDYFAKG